MLPLPGIDISQFQGTVDFASAKASGKAAFIYCRATQGVSIKDSNFQEYHIGCKMRGIPVGGYHFFQFQDDPTAQAEFFTGVLAGYDGDLLPMVDVEAASEPSPNRSVGERIGRLATFTDNLESRLHGKKVIIYTGYSFWNDVMKGSDSFKGHPCWVAAYCNAPAPVPTGWDKVTLWQHTDALSLPGIAGNVDGDLLVSGNLADISR